MHTYTVHACTHVHCLHTHTRAYTNGVFDGVGEKRGLVLMVKTFATVKVCAHVLVWALASLGKLLNFGYYERGTR